MLDLAGGAVGQLPAAPAQTPASTASVNAQVRHERVPATAQRTVPYSGFQLPYSPRLASLHSRRSHGTATAPPRAAFSCIGHATERDTWPCLVCDGATPERYGPQATHLASILGNAIAVGPPERMFHPAFSLWYQCALPMQGT